ncbi:MAG: helix-turn-helix domain-containing protein, partial [Planctomycetota bacterium]
REDLFYRLNVIALELPPLRERPGDIENLARTFVETISEQVGRPGLQLDAEAMRALSSYTWPGNIRELRNVIERAAVLAETRILGVEDLPPEFSMGSSPSGTRGETNRATGFHDRVEAFRSAVLLEALEAHEGHQTKAAESLGLQRSYFARLLKKYGLTGA